MTGESNESILPSQFVSYIRPTVGVDQMSVSPGLTTAVGPHCHFVFALGAVAQRMILARLEARAAVGLRPASSGTWAEWGDSVRSSRAVCSRCQAGTRRRLHRFRAPVRSSRPSGTGRSSGTRRPGSRTARRSTRCCRCSRPLRMHSLPCTRRCHRCRRAASRSPHPGSRLPPRRLRALRWLDCSSRIRSRAPSPRGWPSPATRTHLSSCSTSVNNCNMATPAAPAPATPRHAKETAENAGVPGSRVSQERLPRGGPSSEPIRKHGRQRRVEQSPPRSGRVVKQTFPGAGGGGRATAAASLSHPSPPSPGPRPRLTVPMTRSLEPDVSVVNCFGEPQAGTERAGGVGGGGWPPPARSVPACGVVRAYGRRD